MEERAVNVAIFNFSRQIEQSGHVLCHNANTSMRCPRLDYTGQSFANASNFESNEISSI